MNFFKFDALSPAGLLLSDTQAKAFRFQISEGRFYNIRPPMPRSRILNWSDPMRLSLHRQCPKGPGLYAIGEWRDPSQPIKLATDYDAYMGRWPDNFRGLYIGISRSSGSGIRGRIRSHQRGRGCKGLLPYIASGVELYFVYISGIDVTDFEALYVSLSQPEMFRLNQRSEIKRQALRFWRERDNETRAAGHEVINFGAIPDYFEDG